MIVLAGCRRGLDRVSGESRSARVHLWVTETNGSARLLYERCGFRPTAERQPLPSNPGLMEMGMVRSR